MSGNGSPIAAGNDPRPWCVIGAGPSGLTALKNFLARGIACQAFEREDDVGGNWNFGRPSSSVCESTRLISSKRLTEFTDFPMPADYPPFPTHRQALAYLRAYAREFGLYEHIALGTSIARVEPLPQGWRVSTSDGRTREFGGLIVANGHHWDPLWPDLPGTFDGDILHAHDYKSADQVRGKRVLVIGAGNSGCDIAVDAAQHAAAAWISLRRGYHFLPKFLLGKPIDVCGDRLLRWRLPLWLRRWIAGALVRVALGKPELYGLPKPDHRLFETHPIVNSQLLYFLGHGAVRAKPPVQELRGTEALFADGTREAVDLIVCATGYRVSFPFLDQSWLLAEDGQPRLFLNVFHPERDDLLAAGLIQPNSGQWGLTDLQMQLAAAYIAERARDPAGVAWFRRLKAQGQGDLAGGIRFFASPRHALEVEYFSYRERLKQLLRKMPAAPAANSR